MSLVGFAVIEYLGVHRWHGMIPLTWVVRCMPRYAMAAATLLGLWHFMWVVTVVKKVIAVY